jgi:hypothetical protein
MSKVVATIILLALGAHANPGDIQRSSIDEDFDGALSERAFKQGRFDSSVLDDATLGKGEDDGPPAKGKGKKAPPAKGKKAAPKKEEGGGGWNILSALDTTGVTPQGKGKYAYRGKDFQAVGGGAFRPAPPPRFGGKIPTFVRPMFLADQSAWTLSPLALLGYVFVGCGVTLAVFRARLF